MQLLSKNIKKDFPIFRQKPYGRPLIYLDSAASTQKPRAVIEAVKDCYERYYANVHRGLYYLSNKSSAAYEEVRNKAAKFINAGSTKEIIFTRNATESINLVAFAWGRQNIRAGDEIILTEMEHHANIVPWQVLAKEKNARLKYIPIMKDGRLDLVKMRALLSKKTKLVAMTHMSNVLGTINPVAKIIKQLRRHKGLRILIDGAQSVAHFPVDMQKIGADFYAFSSHKMLGPAGVGVLYAKEELLESMPPFMTGGDMISQVTKDSAEWNELPWKFEAGTPNIAGVIGFGAAIDYLRKIGMGNIFKHDEALAKKALAELQKIEGLTIYGPREVKDRGAVISFSMKNIHPHDLASILDEQGMAIRAGHHCAQPLHQVLGIEATARASFYLYNTPADVAALVKGLKKAKEVLSL